MRAILFIMMLTFGGQVFAQEPNISSFEPQSGPVGSEVVIVGSNFDETPSNNIVFFGAVRATVNSSTKIRLSVTVPPGATFQPISVLVNGQVAYTTKPFLISFGGEGITDESFANYLELETGQSTGQATLGDLDGDGKSELIITYATGISVLRNTSAGDGTISYATKQDFSTGTYAIQATIADFDGDGMLDVAVINNEDQTISVLRNTSVGIGSISFADKVDLSSGEEPSSIAFGDFDLDGKVDLAITNISDNNLSVYRNSSTGIGTIMFETKVDLASGSLSGPFCVVSGDIDSDGRVDLIVANWNNSTVSTLLNTSTESGELNFAEHQSFGVGQFPEWLAVGDLDGDGKLDVVTANRGDDNVSVLRNTSTGSGTASYSISTLEALEDPVRVAIDDLDGDGKKDIVLTQLKSSNWEEGSLSVFRNSSTSPGVISFADNVNYKINEGFNNSLAYCLAVGDLDNDGQPELVSARNIEKKALILKNLVKPIRFLSFSFSEQIGETKISVEDKSIEITVARNADLTGLVASFVLSDGTTAKIGTVNQTSGTSENDFTNSVTYTLENGSESTTWNVTTTKLEVPSISSFVPLSGPVGTIVTLNGESFVPDINKNKVYFDGIEAEVVAASSSQLNVSVPIGASYNRITALVEGLVAYAPGAFVVSYGGQGISTSTFEEKVELTLGDYSPHVASADINQDGKVDVVTASVWQNTFSIFENSSTTIGSIAFEAKQDFDTSSEPFMSIIEDVDGDGTKDIVILTNGNLFEIYQNKSASGSISLVRQASFTTNPNPKDGFFHDLDEDGRPDLVIVHDDSNLVSVYRNISTGPGSFNFDSDKTFTIGDDSSAVESWDLDGDGKPEIIVVNSNSNTVSVLRNISSQADIDFDEKIDLVTGETPLDLAIGDLDGNGLDDLVVLNNNSRNVSIFGNNSAGPGSISFTDKVDIPIGDHPFSIALGDVDGDGRLDIIVPINGESTISVIRMISPTENVFSYSNITNFDGITSPMYVDIADFDGDGKLDLAGSGFDEHAISIYRNATISGGDAANIVAFSIPEQVGSAQINSGNRTIDIIVGTEEKFLTPSFTLSEGATATVNDRLQVSGSSTNDFTNPVSYIVTSEDGSNTLSWEVSVDYDDKSDSDDQDAVAPEISNIVCDKHYLIASGGLSIQATITDESDLSKVSIYHKKITDLDYISADMLISGKQYEYVFTDTMFDDLGVEFYIQATDISGNTSRSDTSSVATETSGNRGPISGIKSSNNHLDYAIISIPYQEQDISSVFLNLGEFDDREWKLAKYSGNTAYDYYPASFDVFVPGQGYWFLTNKAADFEIQGGRSVAANSNTPFKIQLRGNDWNMVGNPYPFNIDWQSVIDHNASLGISVEKLVTFSDKQYHVDQLTLKKYQGAFLYVSAAVELEIPVSASMPTAARQLSGAPNENSQNFGLGAWTFPLGLKGEFLKYNVASFGMSENATNGRDHLDWPMLPRLSSYLEIEFEDGLARSNVFIDDSYVWEFKVNSNSVNEKVTLNWENEGLKKSNYSIRLLDIMNKKMINLEEFDDYSFTMQSTQHEFKLFFASKEEIFNVISSEDSWLGNPYPNPFLNEITIPLMAKKEGTLVVVRIVNVLGERLLSTQLSNLKSGYQELKLDLTKHLDDKFSSSPYILMVTLESESGVQSLNKKISYKR